MFLLLRYEYLYIKCIVRYILFAAILKKYLASYPQLMLRFPDLKPRFTCFHADEISTVKESFKEILVHRLVNEISLLKLNAHSANNKPHSYTTASHLVKENHCRGFSDDTRLFLNSDPET